MSEDCSQKNLCGGPEGLCRANAKSESKSWPSFEQRLIKDTVAKFSDGKYFLSLLRNSSCLLPLETIDKIR